LSEAVERRRDARVTLVTPEGMPLELELAGAPERLFAIAIDLFAIGLALVVLLLLLILLGMSALIGEEIGALLILGLFVLRHGYFLFFELSWQGTSPGKRLLGLRVVSRDGAALGADAVFARGFLRDIELFLPLVAISAPAALIGPSPAWLLAPALGWIVILALMPLVSREHTRAGDLVAGTVVVRVPRAALMVDEAAPHSVRSGALVFEKAQLDVYGEHELETLASLLRDAETGRADVFDLRIVAETIGRKIRYSGNEPTVNPERFLRAFYRAQRAALEKGLLLGKRKASQHDRR
jgi:uncharacterized RDD family membrane protein YckC